MFYNVLFYLIVFDLSGKYFEIYRYDNHTIVSPVPITECTGIKEKTEGTREKSITYYCQTERIYYHITGQDVIKITTTGEYDT